MKKTYISPNMLVVRLAMTRPLATSTLEYGDDITSGTIIEGDAKGISNVNVWDDEW